MKYIVLRDCFVGGIYYAKGSICDIPDNIEKSPKNFRPLNESENANTKPAISDVPKTLYDIAQTKPDIIGQELPEEPKDFEEFVANIEDETKDDPPLYVSDKPKRGRPKKR